MTYQVQFSKYMQSKTNKKDGGHRRQTENVRQGKTERRWTDMQKHQHWGEVVGGGGGGGKRHTTRKRSRETARKRSESGGQTEIKRGQFT